VLYRVQAGADRHPEMVGSWPVCEQVAKLR
jgi:hypothetical protein